MPLETVLLEAGPLESIRMAEEKMPHVSGKGLSGRGEFVVFEGGDESGKTTHARWVAERRGAVFTYEPGGAVGTEAYRKALMHSEVSPRAEALLFAADRAEHVHQVISPALEQGQDVVCDRYIGSSLAYQAFGRGFELADIWGFSKFATDGLLPDVVLLLHIPYEVYAERRQQSLKGITRFDRETEDFHRRVAEGYLELAGRDPEKWVVIDGTQAPEEVRREVCGVLAGRFGWEL